MIDPFILTRALHIAATLVAGGTVAFMVLIADVPALRRRLVVMVWIALAVAILSGLAWLVLLASEILGTPLAEVCLHGGAWRFATDTRLGEVAGARLLLALGLALLLPFPAARWLQLAAAAGFMALTAFTGHGGATPGAAGVVHLAADVVHLVAAGFWLGALPAFALLLAEARRDAGLDGAVATAARRFSPLGIACVGALLLTGAINAGSLLAGPRDLLATDYGRVLLLKVGLFLAMVAIAAVNKFHLTPQLPAPRAMRALSRNSWAEIGIGAGIVLLVGALGTMEPSGHIHEHSGAVPPDAAYVHIHDVQAMADVAITPGRPGRTGATIRLSREDGSEFPAKELTFTLEPTASGGKSVQATATYTAGFWQTGNIDIPVAGIWTVRIVVTPADGAPIVLDAPIVIEP